MHKQSLEMGLTSFGLVFEHSGLRLYFIKPGRIASFNQSLTEELSDADL